MRFLIVDDEQTTRNMNVVLLTDFAECEEATSGSEALAKVKDAYEMNAPYDLILLDIVMPEMDGHATGKAIRDFEKGLGISADKRIKIVMVTALNSPQAAMDSFSTAQSAAYVVKPVTRESLLGVIAKLGLKRK
jgi:two-component system chemotaxis response regulator CheY